MGRKTGGPTVVLVGRPNVGKSTLFNRITGIRRSIVAPVAGTTRDILTASTLWRDRTFTLVDTGGLFGATTDPLHVLVAANGHKALKSADVIVFVVDAQDGLVPADLQIAEAARALGRPILLAINKTDDKEARERSSEFHRLGFDPALEVSAEHGSGVYELLDAVADRLPAGGSTADSVEQPGEIKVAIVGRPNVGKSSLVNRLAREERVMVNELPGTTRDTVDVLLNWKGHQLRLVDTAGMRKPGRVARSGQVEAVSVVLAKRALARADVAVVVVDALEGAGDREGAIAGEAEEAGCGVILVVNKWDLVKGRGEAFVKDYDDKLRFQLRFLDFAPLLHLSALTGDRTPKLLEAIVRVAEARQRRVPTAELNRFIEAVTEANPPTSKTSKHVRIMYAAQTGVAPPRFVLFTNVATELHFSYERYLVNRIRESFGFEGVPVRLTVRRRGREKA